MPDLDPRERRFVVEYLIDLDPKRAAIAAGYSKTMAATKAYQWVSNGKVKPHVFAAVSAAQAERAKRTQIDADWVLKRLADEADADVADLYDEDGALKPIKEWPAIWRKGLVAGIDVVEEFETVDGKKERVGVVRKVRLSDRIKRIELIGKHVDVQAFREKVSLENPDGTPVAQSPRDLAREIAFALAAGQKAGK